MEERLFNWIIRKCPVSIYDRFMETRAYLSKRHKKEFSIAETLKYLLDVYDEIYQR